MAETTQSSTGEYVRRDIHGVMRVGTSHILLDGIVLAFRDGIPAESIQQQYPDLSLEQVYGAITYYLGHRQEVDDYLAEQGARWEAFQRESEQSEPSVVKRLRELMICQASEAEEWHDQIVYIPFT